VTGIETVDTLSSKRTLRAQTPGGPRRAPVPRAPRGGYACGEETRRRILETAIELFAQLGFPGTSTRAIATRAQVSLPALQYYFGGKQGLHRACIEYITEDVRVRLEPAARRVREALCAGPLSRGQLLALLRSLHDPLLEALATDRPESWALFFARAQSEHNEAFEAIYQRIGGRLVALMTDIIARLLEEPATGAHAQIRAVALIGQATLVRRARPLMLKALGWPDFAGERLSTLKAVLWRSIEASLGGP
jgi:AcrR family transcriptional regulator